MPYIEEKNVYNIGKGLTQAQKRVASGERMANVIPVYNCPTRRRPTQFPYTGGTSHYISVSPPNFVARTDYAACGGSQGYTTNGFSPYKGPPESALNQRDDQVAANYSAAMLKTNGVSSMRSEVSPRHITDGTSKTYIVGEKYLPYLRTEGGDGSNGDDNQSWDTSYDWDTYRWTNIFSNITNGTFLAKDGKGAYPGEPYSDFGPTDVTINNQNFGSSHTSVFIMAFADGSVQPTPFDIELRLHHTLGLATMVCRRANSWQMACC